MGKTATESTGAQKMVPADCVSVLLMAVGSTTISKSQYDMMSALDGTRTASSFEHQFRSITAKAKELKARAENGENSEPLRPANKRASTNSTASPATPRKRKASGDDGDDTPSKKKSTPKKSPAPKKKVTTESPESDSPNNDYEANSAEFLQNVNEFIKHEQLWEDAFT